MKLMYPVLLLFLKLYCWSPPKKTILYSILEHIVLPMISLINCNPLVVGSVPLLHYAFAQIAFPVETRQPGNPKILPGVKITCRDNARGMGLLSLVLAPVFSLPRILLTCARLARKGSWRQPKFTSLSSILYVESIPYKQIVLTSKMNSLENHVDFKDELWHYLNWCAHKKILNNS